MGDDAEFQLAKEQAKQLHRNLFSSCLKQFDETEFINEEVHNTIKINKNYDEYLRSLKKLDILTSWELLNICFNLISNLVIKAQNIQTKREAIDGKLSLIGRDYRNNQDNDFDTVRREMAYVIVESDDEQEVLFLQIERAGFDIFNKTETHFRSLYKSFVQKRPEIFRPMKQKLEFLSLQVSTMALNWSEFMKTARDEMADTARSFEDIFKLSPEDIVDGNITSDKEETESDNDDSDEESKIQLQSTSDSAPSNQRIRELAKEVGFYKKDSNVSNRKRKGPPKLISFPKRKRNNKDKISIRNKILKPTNNEINIPNYQQDPDHPTNIKQRNKFSFFTEKPKMGKPFQAQIQPNSDNNAINDELSKNKKNFKVSRQGKQKILILEHDNVCFNLDVPLLPFSITNRSHQPTIDDYFDFLLKSNDPEIIGENSNQERIDSLEHDSKIELIKSKDQLCLKDEHFNWDKMSEYWESKLIEVTLIPPNNLNNTSISPDESNLLSLLKNIWDQQPIKESSLTQRVKGFNSSLLDLLISDVKILLQLFYNLYLIETQIKLQLEGKNNDSEEKVLAFEFDWNSLVMKASKYLLRFHILFHQKNNVFGIFYGLKINQSMYKIDGINHPILPSDFYSIPFKMFNDINSLISSYIEEFDTTCFQSSQIFTYQTYQLLKQFQIFFILSHLSYFREHYSRISESFCKNNSLQKFEFSDVENQNLREIFHLFHSHFLSISVEFKASLIFLNPLGVSQSQSLLWILSQNIRFVLNDDMALPSSLWNVWTKVLLSEERMLISMFDIVSWLSLYSMYTLFQLEETMSSKFSNFEFPKGSKGLRVEEIRSQNYWLYYSKRFWNRLHSSVLVYNPIVQLNNNLTIEKNVNSLKLSLSLFLSYLSRNETVGTEQIFIPSYLNPNYFALQLSQESQQNIQIMSDSFTSLKLESLENLWSGLLLFSNIHLISLKYANNNLIKVPNFWNLIRFLFQESTRTTLTLIGINDSPNEHILKTILDYQIKILYRMNQCTLFFDNNLETLDIFFNNLTQLQPIFRRIPYHQSSINQEDENQSDLTFLQSFSQFPVLNGKNVAFSLFRSYLINRKNLTNKRYRRKLNSLEAINPQTGGGSSQSFDLTVHLNSNGNSIFSALTHTLPSPTEDKLNFNDITQDISSEPIDSFNETLYFWIENRDLLHKEILSVISMLFNTYGLYNPYYSSLNQLLGINLCKTYQIQAFHFFLDRFRNEYKRLLQNILADDKQNIQLKRLRLFIQNKKKKLLEIFSSNPTFVQGLLLCLLIKEHIHTFGRNQVEVGWNLLTEIMQLFINTDLVNYVPYQPKQREEFTNDILSNPDHNQSTDHLQSNIHSLTSIQSDQQRACLMFFLTLITFNPFPLITEIQTSVDRTKPIISSGSKVLSPNDYLVYIQNQLELYSQDLLTLQPFLQVLDLVNNIYSNTFFEFGGLNLSTLQLLYTSVTSCGVLLSRLEGSYAQEDISVLFAHKIPIDWFPFPDILLNQSISVSNALFQFSCNKLTTIQSDSSIEAFIPDPIPNKTSLINQINYASLFSMALTLDFIDSYASNKLLVWTTFVQNYRNISFSLMSFVDDLLKTNIQSLVNSILPILNLFLPLIKSRIISICKKILETQLANSYSGDLSIEFPEIPLNQEKNFFEYLNHFSKKKEKSYILENAGVVSSFVSIYSNLINLFYQLKYFYQIHPLNEIMTILQHLAGLPTVPSNNILESLKPTQLMQTINSIFFTLAPIPFTSSLPMTIAINKSSISQWSPQHYDYYINSLQFSYYNELVLKNLYYVENNKIYCDLSIDLIKSYLNGFFFEQLLEHFFTFCGFSFIFEDQSWVSKARFSEFLSGIAQLFPFIEYEPSKHLFKHILLVSWKKSLEFVNIFIESNQQSFPVLEMMQSIFFSLFDLSIKSPSILSSQYLQEIKQFSERFSLEIIKSLKFLNEKLNVSKNKNQSKNFLEIEKRFVRELKMWSELSLFSYLKVSVDNHSITNFCVFPSTFESSEVYFNQFLCVNVVFPYIEDIIQSFQLSSEDLPLNSHLFLSHENYLELLLPSLIQIINVPFATRCKEWEALLQPLYLLYLLHTNSPSSGWIQKLYNEIFYGWTNNLLLLSKLFDSNNNLFVISEDQLFTDWNSYFSFPMTNSMKTLVSHLRRIALIIPNNCDKISAVFSKIREYIKYLFLDNSLVPWDFSRIAISEKLSSISKSINDLSSMRYSDGDLNHLRDLIKTELSSIFP